jgi:hypothetical protein
MDLIIIFTRLTHYFHGEKLEDSQPPFVTMKIEKLKKNILLSITLYFNRHDIETFIHFNHQRRQDLSSSG